MAVESSCWILLAIVSTIACFGNVVLAQMMMAPAPSPMAASGSLPPRLSPSPFSSSPAPSALSSSPVPSPSSFSVDDCITILAGDTFECLDFVTPGSNATAPTPGCCTGLGTVVKEAPQCLCLLLASPSNDSSLPSVNQTKALELPAICKVTTPPVSECSAVIASPVSAPSSVSSPPSLSPESSTGLDNCLTTLATDVYDCLDFAGGNQTQPSESCCTGLGTVVNTAPQCLCLLLSSDPTAAGLPAVNQTKALELPTLCNVTTPPPSACAAIIGSSGSPTPEGAPPLPLTTDQRTVPDSKASSMLSLSCSFLLLLLPLFIIGL